MVEVPVLLVELLLLVVLVVRGNSCIEVVCLIVVVECLEKVAVVSTVEVFEWMKTLLNREKFHLPSHCLKTMAVVLHCAMAYH